MACRGWDTANPARFYVVISLSGGGQIATLSGFGASGTETSATITGQVAAGRPLSLPCGTRPLLR